MESAHQISEQNFMLNHRKERNIVIGLLDSKANKFLQVRQDIKEVGTARFSKYKAKESSATQQQNSESELITFRKG
jgi:hypothetical protein